MEDYSAYSKVLQEVLPSATVELSENKPYYSLDDGHIVEAFDTQALGALETDLAKYWYPQYLATVIIALDRDQTNAQVSTWSDLLDSQEEIGFLNRPGDLEMITAAMSYGLEGEEYTLTKTIQLLSSLRKNNGLKINSFESPIIICYDYQAATLIENGRNIEIIIPSQGTFTYKKGLLSNKELYFQGNINQLLLGAKLRLLDGKSDPLIYPDKKDYDPAIRVNDYKYFAKITQNANPFIQRRVLHSNIFMSIDQREHLFFALAYILLVTIWVTSILRRSMQRGVSYAAFFTGIILNLWTLVRLIKYQIVAVPVLTRYLWYAFYIFQLSLPLVLLWMAWAIDKPENKIFPPKWWWRMAILISFLIILVFTNDLHGYVFTLDLSRPDWDINYSYGWGYYTVLFISMANLLTVFAILIKKSLKNPRKIGMIFPLILFIVFALYNYQYISRHPLVYETDLTIVTGFFALLMFEVSIRSGLIPVNTKYIDLFKQSPLRLQIINKEGDLALASANPVSVNKELLERVLASSPQPILHEEDFLIFATTIPGGYAIWQEDISKIQKLYRKIQDSSQMLARANALLTEEERLKRHINQRNAKKELMEQLEAEIAENFKRLSKMIEELAYLQEEAKGTTPIALLLSYIKRRCNLFFREKEGNSMCIGELVEYIDELSEISKHANFQVAIENQIKDNIDIRYATLFYDFFYALLDFLIQKGCAYMIIQFAIEEELLIMRLLPSENIGVFSVEPRLTKAISAAKGNIFAKDLQETIGISISFPKGGDIND